MIQYLILFFFSNRILCFKIDLQELQILIDRYERISNKNNTSSMIKIDFYRKMFADLRRKIISFDNLNNNNNSNMNQSNSSTPQEQLTEKNFLFHQSRQNEIRDRQRKSNMSRLRFLFISIRVIYLFYVTYSICIDRTR